MVSNVNSDEMKIISSTDQIVVDNLENAMQLNQRLIQSDEALHGDLQ